MGNWTIDRATVRLLCLTAILVTSLLGSSLILAVRQIGINQMDLQWNNLEVQKEVFHFQQLINEGRLERLRRDPGEEIDR
jgi:hypothetical protein